MSNRILGVSVILATIALAVLIEWSNRPIAQTEQSRCDQCSELAATESAALRSGNYTQALIARDQQINAQCGSPLQHLACPTYREDINALSRVLNDRR